MTELEKQLRRSDRLRIGLVLALCLIIAVPVVVVMAASPDPSASGTASGDPVQPTASAAATLDTNKAPAATDAPKTDDGDRDDDKVSRAGRGAITITAINGSNLSLRTDDGWTRSIAVTTATTVTKGGQTITVADLDVGDQIRFSQKRNADGTYTITAIKVPTPKASGEVTAVGGSSLTLKRRNGETQTITLNGSTQYKVGDAAGSKSDVTVGSKVTVQGTVSGDTFTALTVNVKPTVVAGEVTAKTSNSLTLKRRDGSTIVVHVSADTKYRMRGTETPSLADLAVGDVAWAAGTVRADGSLDANAVVKGGRGQNKRDKSVDPQKSPAASTTPG